MTQFVFVTDEQVLRKVIREEIAEIKNESKTELDLSGKMTREKAAKFLGVSYTTMYNWLKDGILKEHGYARKKYLLSSELIEAMQNNS